MGFTSSLRRLVTAPSAICKTFLINYRQDSISFRAAPPYQSPASDLFSPCFCPFVRQGDGEFNSELERAFLQPAIICRLTRSRTRFGRVTFRAMEPQRERERERERREEGRKDACTFRVRREKPRRNVTFARLPVAKLPTNKTRRGRVPHSQVKVIPRRPSIRRVRRDGGGAEKFLPR